MFEPGVTGIWKCGNRKLLIALAAFGALLVSLPSLAAATSLPAPGYEQFKGCPNPEQNPSIVTCFREVVSGGELQMGKIKIPISNAITLRGGETGGGVFDFNSSGGLTKVNEKVPGGVIGLTGETWLLEFFGSAALTVNAVIELAGIPGDQLTEPASLPIKVHFVNSVLGKNCYVGSNANPIKLNLITGTTSPPPPNKPITGVAGEPETTGSGIEHLMNGTYVDNSFAVPGASGCVLTVFGFPPESLDSAIDEQSALPSAAGNNQTIQKFDTETASAPLLVYP